MLILGIDSSTESGALGLYRQEEGIIGEVFTCLPQTHSQRLMPELDHMLKGAHLQVEDLDGIAVTVGPGSFTGIRIGIATARTLAQVLDIPLVGVSTLRLLAENIRYSSSVILPLLDARGGRVYAGFYQQGKEVMESFHDQGLFTPHEVSAILKEHEVASALFFGSGLLEYSSYFMGDNSYNLLLEKDAPEHYPHGGLLARIGYQRIKDQNYSSLYSLQPNYLKESSAVRKREREGNG